METLAETKREVKPVTWIGKSIKRKEDPILITGSGTFIDDIHLDGMLYAGFVRSSYAHALIESVQFSKVYSHQGVEAAVQGKDFALRIRSWMNIEGLKEPQVCSLATGKVRYVGEPVAAVVTRNRYLAEDLVERVDVEYKPLNPVVDAEKALTTRDLIFEDWHDNLLFHKKYGHGDADEAIHNSDVVIRERLQSQRHSATPMETRGIVASYNRFSEELTVWVSTQMPHLMKSLIAESLGIDESRVRVIAPNVGGGFGLKSTLYQDELAVCQLSMRLGKPVKWIETRTEHLLTSAHARDQIHYVEAGFKKDGTLAGLRDKIIVDFGAGGAIWNGIAPALVTCGSIPGPYKFKNFSYDLHCVVTNKTPFGAHRGFGRPVASYVMERVMDIAARKLGIDPALIRGKNLIQKSDMPYTSPSGLTYDSGNY
ncbi:MAG: xanthine dehydrogenase family protein molybdopterin-binding subunit, partial [Nitrososphaerota archaeon]|nr:xanthine dehydrogenase family protein molybdopterin-binding subunit [Nitrososphaerota archaeon]